MEALAKAGYVGRTGNPVSRTSVSTFMRKHGMAHKVRGKGKKTKAPPASTDVVLEDVTELLTSNLPDRLKKHFLSAYSGKL